jgi:chitinase
VATSQNNDKKQSWAFKRDYDVSWLNKQIAISKNDWWETTSQAFVDAGHGTVGAPEDIFCAVNHFGQDDVYRFPVSKSGHTFNAMCFRPPDKREDKTNGWPGRGNIHRCIVEFQQPDTGGGAAGDSSKREWTVNREFPDGSMPSCRRRHSVIC